MTPADDPLRHSMAMAPPGRMAAGSRRHPAWRFVPLIILAAGLILFFALGLGDRLSLEALREHRVQLSGFVSRHGLAAAALYLALYAAVVAFSIPGALVLTVAAGFLFGTAAAVAVVAVGATAGAVVVFLATRSALGGLLQRRAGPWLQRLEGGFRRDAFRYLLILRLVPLVPFWLVNLIPGLLGVRLGTFVLATALGILPGTIVFAGFGAGLGQTLDSAAEPGLAQLATPSILLPLAGLCLIVLSPAIYRFVRRHRRA